MKRRDQINSAAIIVDIVGSRVLQNRQAAQEAIMRAFEQAERMVPPIVAVQATVGDEFQGVFASVSDALLVTLIAQVSLSGEAEIRCGIGWGESIELPSSGDVKLRDGSAWWNAREAIDTAHLRSDSGFASARNWCIGSPLQGGVNAYLVMRDHVVSRMTSRERRIAAAHCLGLTQKQVAQLEKISQPAVSMALHKSGAAAILSGLQELTQQLRVEEC
ncbi:SatD family protein [Actinomyces minihominis]|uniref:SatD family protein n=1 Tax=Actinomyces minihominis TaxID=2002838 RepID=UPI000C076F70|nr:SatD family protein [Actinomyces minihominis]